MSAPTTHWSTTGRLHTGTVDGCEACEVPEGRAEPYSAAARGAGGGCGRFRAGEAEFDRSNDYPPVTTDDAQEGAQ